MVPIVIGIIVTVMLFSMLSSGITSILSGGRIVYNEKEFQRYANNAYISEFGTTSAPEDNILIVFLVNEGDYNGYYTIAWVGDNIQYKINESFGDESTAFGKAMYSSINSEDYEFSISSNLAMAISKMTDSVEEMGLDSSFIAQKSHENMTESHIVNRSELPITAETVNVALREFTEKTDIPMVVVVDSTENVFGKSFSQSDLIVMVLLLAIFVAVIVVIIKTVKRYNAEKNNGNGNDSNRYDTNEDSDKRGSNYQRKY